MSIKNKSFTVGKYGQKYHQKPKLSPLVDLVKNANKTNNFIVGNVGQKGQEKMSDIHRKSLLGI